MLAKKVSHKKLRKLMAERGLTGFQVAKILGLKPQTVYLFICGVRPLQKRHLDKIQKATQA